jgi:tyrosinase
MKLSSILLFIALGVISSQGHYVPPIDHDYGDKRELGRLVEDIKAKMSKFLNDREAELHARGQTALCTAKNVVFRRE